jgi:hypothetical protein
MLGVALVGSVIFRSPRGVLGGLLKKCETSCAQPFFSRRAGYDGDFGTAGSQYATEILARSL